MTPQNNDIQNALGNPKLKGALAIAFAVALTAFIFYVIASGFVTT